jgi:hypothetical protein
MQQDLFSTTVVRTICSSIVHSHLYDTVHIYPKQPFVFDTLNINSPAKLPSLSKVYSYSNNAFNSNRPWEPQSVIIYEVCIPLHKPPQYVIIMYLTFNSVSPSDPQLSGIYTVSVIIHEVCIVMCSEYPMLWVSLDCPFSNVYLILIHWWTYNTRQWRFVVHLLQWIKCIYYQHNAMHDSTGNTYLNLYTCAISDWCTVYAVTK